MSLKPLGDQETGEARKDKRGKVSLKEVGWGCGSEGDMLSWLI